MINNKKLFWTGLLMTALFLGATTQQISAQETQKKERVSSFTTKTTYTYTFSGQLFDDQIPSLENEVKQLTGVKSAKVTYKPDSKKGMLTVFVMEKQRTSESQVMFSVKELKNKLVAYQLSPGELNEVEKVIEK